MDPWHDRPLEDRILVEEPGLLVVDKPWGMPSTGRSLADPDCLQWHLVHRNGGARVWAAHQLDADTTGLNVFTTVRRQVQALQHAMQWPSGVKTYRALVHGRPAFDEHVCEAPIGRDPDDPRSLAVTTDGKPCWSRFRTLSRGPAHALVEVEIRTGRTHQIRIHAQHLGHPLVGEEWYRPSPCTLHPRQALHAQRLQLTSLGADWSAPWPEDLHQLALRLNIDAGMHKRGQGPGETDRS